MTLISENWYMAEMIQQLKADGEESHTVYINFLLINAESSEAAYQRAIEVGEELIFDYASKNTHVQSLFRGLRNLTKIQGTLEHGAILYQEKRENLPHESVAKMVKNKEKLNVFASRDEGREQAYIPEYAGWYVAEVIHGTKPVENRIETIWLKMLLIRADLPQAAYDAAITLGKNLESDHLLFYGLRELSVIHEKDLEHGSEIIFEAFESMTKEQIESLILYKESLHFFINT